jgi:hypothetical protein
MTDQANIIKRLIENYEQDLLGNWYTFTLSDGVTLSFTIEKKDVPHLMGIRKLPLRQVQNKSALAVYDMLKDGRINVSHIVTHKEEYKKVMNFSQIVNILHCGDAVKVVKRVSRLHSSYFLYLDHSPNEIVHLGIVNDPTDNSWHPESLLINQNRNVTAYIDDQLPVDILNMTVSRCEEDTADKAYMI